MLTQLTGLLLSSFAVLFVNPRPAGPTVCRLIVGFIKNILTFTYLLTDISLTPKSPKTPNPAWSQFQAWWVNVMIPLRFRIQILHNMNMIYSRTIRFIVQRSMEYKVLVASVLEWMVNDAAAVNASKHHHHFKQIIFLCICCTNSINYISCFVSSTVFN